MLHDYRLFFREYLRHFHNTGAIAPSSRWLAAALARYVQPGEKPLRILEVGPGTGAVTRHIVPRLGPADSLDLVELNDRFVERLQCRFASEPVFAAVADRARIIHRPIEELPAEASYDVIISGLPLNNFSVAAVERILNVLAGLLAPGGTLSFFEYIAVRPARALVSGKADRRRLRGIAAALAETLRRGEFRRECVWTNLPPAWVHHLRLDSQPPRPG